MRPRPLYATIDGWLQQVRDAVLPHDIFSWSQEDTGFRHFFDAVDLRQLAPDAARPRLRDGALYYSDLPTMVRVHAAHPTEHVLITASTGNWGAFSYEIRDRTVDWGSWESSLEQAGSSPAEVLAYLDDPRVRAVLTTNHSAIRHRKLVYIPLGVPDDHAPVVAALRTGSAVKTQELMINNSGWRHRAAINAGVIDRFRGQVVNSYGCGTAAYYAEMLAARFVLCPSGFGWDTYRIWEALALGAVPIVERSPGWDALLDDLPALLVGDFAHVTPALLRRAYPQIAAQRQRFDFAKLTRQYWVRRVNALLSR